MSKKKKKKLQVITARIGEDRKIEMIKLKPDLYWIRTTRESGNQKLITKLKLTGDALDVLAEAKRRLDLIERDD